MKTRKLRIPVALILALAFTVAAHAGVFGYMRKPKPLPAGVKETLLVALDDKLERLSIFSDGLISGALQVGDILNHPVGNDYVWDAQATTDLAAEIADAQALKTAIEAIP